MSRSPRRKSLRSILASCVLTGLFACGLGCGSSHDHGSHDHGTPRASAADPSVKPYPLKTCVVSGEELGKMGEPFRLTYKGQEIKLCCKGCEKDFNKEPEKFLQKIAAASGK